MALVTILFGVLFSFVLILGYFLFLKNSSNLLIVALLFIIVFLIILALTGYNSLIVLEKHSTDYTKIGPYGDYIGGVLNPLISVFAVFAAGFAFYAQYDANRQVQDQFKIQQFESQFYEMLRLHKENVNSLYLTITKRKKHDETDEIIESNVIGKVVFEHMKFEFNLIYMVALKNFYKEDPKVRLNEAYAIFFNGVSETYKGKHNFFDEILELEGYIDTLDYDSFNTKLREGLNFNRDITQMLQFSLFKGHAHQLAHYYRHLFQTVKFIVYQNENFISYEDKRNYLRILRSQLSNTEQTLLFYNWYSDFGKQWEGDNNKFFTDYRMIHNLFNELIISEFKLENIFDLKIGYRKEKDRLSDNLFEFQDW
jgi:hypothetical protein